MGSRERDSSMGWGVRWLHPLPAPAGFPEGPQGNQGDQSILLKQVFVNVPSNTIAQIPDLLSAHVALAALVKVDWFSKHFLSLHIFSLTFFKCKPWKSKGINHLNNNKNIPTQCSRDDIYSHL